jgi:outer membrane protein OmpA-like peptidoglycan-associated protein
LRRQHGGLARAVYAVVVLGTLAGAVPSALAQAAPSDGNSVEELRAAIEAIKRRLAEQRAAGQTPGGAPDLAQELEQSAQRIKDLTGLVEALRGEREELRSQLAAATERALASEQARDTAGKEAETLRASLAELQTGKERLETAVREARAELEAKARERAEAQAAEAQAAEERARRLDAEVAALRDIARSSVTEVQSLGEQLLAALAENRELVAALGQLRATREMLDGELAAARDEAAAAWAELQASRRAPAAGPSAELVRLELSDTPADGVDGTGLEPAREVDGVPLADAGDGWMMTIPEGLEFAPGSDRITEGSTASLEKVAALIKGFGTPAVRVVGHTEAAGDAAFNRGLSQRRAQAVRAFLVDRYALEPRLITTEGYGEERPIAGNRTWTERQKNRRVEIYVKP